MEPLIIFQDIMTIMIRSVFQVENRWHTENGLLREFHPFVYTEIICIGESRLRKASNAEMLWNSQDRKAITTVTLNALVEGGFTSTKQKWKLE